MSDWTGKRVKTKRRIRQKPAIPWGTKGTVIEDNPKANRFVVQFDEFESKYSIFGVIAPRCTFTYDLKKELFKKLLLQNNEEGEE